MLKTLIIIPAYNEELNIQKTIDDIKKNAPDVDYVVINDGSKDNTLDVLKKYNFHYINGFQNQGSLSPLSDGTDAESGPPKTPPGCSASWQRSWTGPFRRWSGGRCFASWPG